MGSAASLAIFARDRGGPAIARQILIYPMLDDRNTVPNPALEGFLTWSYDDNAAGWGALLGDAIGGPDVSSYGAAARLEDFSGLPPAYIEVGELDLFRDEDIAYAQRLVAAGVSTELHVHADVPHAFEALVPTAAISWHSAADRHRVLQSRSSLTATGAALGTLAYMAPEIFAGARAEPTVDVYALACVLFQPLSGRQPFTGDGAALMYPHLHVPLPMVSGLRPGLPPGLDEVPARGMAKDPSSRRRSAGRWPPPRSRR